MFITQEILAEAKLNPDKVAIHSSTGNITYFEFSELIKKSNFLLSKNSGIKIGIISFSKMGYILALMSIYNSGNIPVALPFEFKDDFLKKLIDRDSIRACVIDGSLINQFQSSLSEMTCIYSIVNNGKSIEEIKSGLISEINPSELQLLMYTSGTTGMPKGVMISKKNIISNTNSIVDILSLDKNDCGGLVIPPNHAFGNSIINTHFYKRGSISVANIGFREDVFKASEGATTIFYGVPSTYTILLENPDRFSVAFKDTKVFASAGGALSEYHIKMIKELCPKSKIVAMYGQTEATARLSYIPPEKIESSIGTIGIPIPGVELKLVPFKDQNSGSLEIVARGDNVMLGYYNDSAATEKKIIDGWLYTGDIGVIGANGFIKIIGRSDDIIKVADYRINPREIERQLLNEIGVKNVFFTSIPHKIMGNCLVGLFYGEKVPFKEINDFFKRNYPSFVCPKEILSITNLPINENGKISNKSIRDYYEKTKM